MSDDYKPKILISNDDGITAEGIIAITTQLFNSGKYDVRVSSPATQQSAKSQSVTLFGEIIAEKYQLPPPLEQIPAWKVHGTPVDCIKIVLYSHIYGSEWSPDLIVSGINDGINTGTSIHYSGTVSVAKEGVLNGVPAIALSLHYDKNKELNFNLAAKYSETIIESVLRSAKEFPSYFLSTVINVNFPSCTEEENKGWVITKQGSSGFKDLYSLAKDLEFDKENNATKKSFKLMGYLDLCEDSIEFDTFAVLNNYNSITPLGLSYYNRKYQAEIEQVVTSWLKK